MNYALLGCVVGATCACAKTPQAASVDSDAMAVTASGAVAGDRASPRAASSTPLPDAVTAWRGSYESVAGTLYIPSEWKNVHWSSAETTAGIGTGTMTLDVDPASGRLRGRLEGPLGPATIDGMDSEGKLVATVAREDPSDHGFMGTLVGASHGGRAEGTMQVSLALAGAIRTATFTLSPAAATPNGPR